MSLTENPVYIHEPTPLQCGQAVLAMLAGVGVEEIIAVVGTERETKLADMFACLAHYGIGYDPQKKAADRKEDLPDICILSLETPRCWHWSLYFRGVFYDPEHGILDDFPEACRKYYFRILP